MIFVVGRVQKWAIMSLLLFVFKYGYPYIKDDLSCGGYTSTLTLLSSEDYCSSFQLEIFYDGVGSFPLDQLFVSASQCGNVDNVTNSGNWDVLLDVTDQYSGLQGFHISSISNFGGDRNSASFTVNFTICADHAVCKCNLQDMVVDLTYESASCIEFDQAEDNDSGTCDLTPPSLIGCNDLTTSQSLYEASSATTNDNVLHSFWLEDVFADGPAKFDLTSGQLVYDNISAQLYGSLTLTSGGGTLTGSEWAVNVNFDETDIVEPVTELGQGPEYTDTWLYYSIEDSSSFLYRIDDPTDVIILTQEENPFQIGLSAGGKDLNEFSGAAWLSWQRDGETGFGEMNINLEDLCPPEGAVSPVLECVEYVEDRGSYIAHFGYSNENDEDIIIPIGDENKFTPTPIDRGQPFVFESGRHIDAFQVEFDGNELVWTLASPDGSGRTATASDNLEQRCIAPPTANLTGDLEICSGEFGELEVQLTGESPWTITYDHSGDSFEVNVAASPFNLMVEEEGVYSLLSVTDNLGQIGSVSGSSTVTFLESPTVVLSGEQAICPDGGTTLLNLTLSGTAPWQITYTNGSEEIQTVIESTTNQYLTVDAIGTYELLSVTDANCSGEVSGQAVVTYYEVPTAELTGGGVVCAGETLDLNLNLTGTTPWNVAYSNGEEEFSLFNVSESSLSFPASEGVYTLTSVNDLHCTGTVSGSAQITTDIVEAVISGGGQICTDQGSALVTIFWSGTLPWSTTYSDGNSTFTIESITSATYTIETNQPGSYSLIEASSNTNCEAQLKGSAEVTTILPLEGEILVNENNCSSDEVALQSSIIGDLIYTWSTDGAGSLIRNGTPSTTYVPAAGEEEVTFFLSIATLCETINLTKTTTITWVDGSFTIDENVGFEDLLQNLEYTFRATETDGDVYEWYINGDLVATGPVVTLSFDILGQYDLELEVTKDGCKGSQTLNFGVELNNKLYIPNVFNPSSPNLENNRIKVYGESIDSNDFEFAIYNRWGKEVYSTSNLQQAQNTGWTGDHRSEELENNVFTYVVRGKYLNGEGFEETGTITLVR